MKLLNIGFGNMVNADRIIGIVSPDSAPIKRLVQDAREKGALIDASYGRRTQAVLIMDSDHVILSGIPLESLTGRANEETEEKEVTMKGEKYLFIVSGPSGTGKDTVVAALLKKHPEIQHTVSATTRSPREGEKDGINYHFMSVADFEDHLAHDQIVEHTKYCENYYGTLRSEIEGRMKLGIPVILVIEVEGAGNIKKMYPGATTIFVLPPDMQELERRLRCRGTEDEETIQRRLKRAEAEIANSVNYDEHVVNIEVDSCAESIYSIIQFKLQHGSDE